MNTTIQTLTPGRVFSSLSQARNIPKELGFHYKKPSEIDSLLSRNVTIAGAVIKFQNKLRWAQINTPSQLISVKSGKVIACFYIPISLSFDKIDDAEKELQKTKRNLSLSEAKKAMFNGKIIFVISYSDNKYHINSIEGNFPQEHEYLSFWG